MSVSLQHEPRPLNQTQGQLNALRKSGWIPAVLYGGEKDPETFQILTKDFLKQMEKSGIYTRVFNLEGRGRALLKSLQFPATKDTPLHADFIRLIDGQTIKIQVPVRFKNEDKAPGLKKGGLLNVVNSRISLIVKCEHIPSEVTIDLSGLEIGHSILVEQILLPEGSKIQDIGAKESMVSIVAPAASEEKEATEKAPAKK
jgi:large subunit ribosomal protein L25